MKGFTKWMVRHRVPVILLCLALLVPSVLGMAATKTKYDLLYYLPQDLETVQGQEILLKDFGKGAFSLLVTEGMTLQEQADMENALKEIPHVESVIGYASATKGMLPLEIIPQNIREMFQRGDCMLSAVFFDEGAFLPAFGANALSVGLGETAVMYLLGVPLFLLVQKNDRLSRAMRTL